MELHAALASFACVAWEEAPQTTAIHEGLSQTYGEIVIPFRELGEDLELSRVWPILSSRTEDEVNTWMMYLHPDSLRLYPTSSHCDEGSQVLQSPFLGEESIIQLQVNKLEPNAAKQPLPLWSASRGQKKRPAATSA